MKYLNLSGLSYFTNKIKSTVADALDGKSDVGHTHTKSEITDFPSGLTVDTTLDGTSSNAISNSAVSNALDGKSDVGHTHTKSQITDFPSYGTTANTICEGNDSRLSDARTPTSHTHVKSEITDFPSLATVATSGSYNDLSNKPTIPTVNDATLTIQKNGSTVKTFTANASSNVTANITVPTKTSELTNDSGFLTSHQDLSGYVPRSGGAVLDGKAYSRTVDSDYLALNGSSTDDNGAFIRLHGKDYNDANYSGCVLIRVKDNINVYDLYLNPNGTAMWGNKNLAMQEYTVPRSGGAVMTGDLLASSTTHSLGFGYGWGNGGTIYTYSPTHSTVDWQGTIRLEPLKTTSNFKTMTLAPDGTWTWSGTAVQIISDQRLKQQIAEIDDKLLDAWEDVELVQFKYNDAVDQKGKDKARLHTGYVVQQIDKACKSHGVDVSAYGLYCHEEYPEETEEVEIEQADGTKTKEKKVIREASEHYSLRYTEVYAVECKYLRRENSRLKEKLASLEERLEKLEKAENSENQEK